MTHNAPPPVWRGKVIALALVVGILFVGGATALLLALDVFGGDESRAATASGATKDPTCGQIATVVKQDGEENGPGWLAVNKAVVFREAFDAPRPKTTPVVLLVCQLTGVDRHGQRAVVTARWVEDPHGAQWVSYEEASGGRVGSVNVSWSRR